MSLLTPPKWPWKRTAYAQVIFMADGGRSTPVAVDVLLAEQLRSKADDELKLMCCSAMRVELLSQQYAEVEII